ncbi:PREDICTED: caprin-1-like [Amphimedon queenslandica]|uniref:Caprin-1 dimerization domain-containing protein n=1 Tax=Amphimedon queenslandica TaxID=400682 RepID=A0A1X7VDN5_AMPQE|nr:PREDICTED: caprin-1-like [Amphimedon queenslandica]|eukprot:XP_003384898.2 PREDICTED: caprin-1-like [Amphimedon queenslandica]
MPTKKNGSATTITSDEGKENKAPAVDEKDPMSLAISVIEKKTRNLEKRKSRLTGLKESGKSLDKDQLDAVSKLPEVIIQIETLRDLLSTFQEAHASQQKEVKKLQKQEEKHRKDTEREQLRSLLKYTLRTQGILNLIDDSSKEVLRSGEGEGVVKLSEKELTQLDEFYDLVNPTRPGNDRYDRSLHVASDHMLSLFEKSQKEVVHTTYDAMHSLLHKLDVCGYFDKVVEEKEEEEEEEEEVDVAPPTAAVEEIREEPVTADTSGRVQSPERLPQQQQQYTGGVTKETDPSEEPFVPLVPMTTEGYHPSAPSPDFSGLQSTALSPLDELTFMRESPKPASQQQNDGQLGGGAYSFDVNETSHQSFSSFPATGGHTHQQDSARVMGLLDEQYVPETGQQVTGEKDKDIREGEAIQSSSVGGPPHYNKAGGTGYRSNPGAGTGGGRQWRGNGSYRGNREMYNGSGGGGYNSRGYPRGGGAASGGNFRGGSNRGGRPNYAYNNNRSGNRGGGAGGSGYRSNPRATAAQ